MMVKAVSLNGNFVLNFGPDGKGNIRSEETKLAKEIGDWMKINKEAIYGTSHSTVQKQDWGYFTQKGNKLYMCVFNRPINNLLKIEIPKGGIIPMKAYFLENNQETEIQNAGKASKSSMEATSIEFSIPQEVYDQAEEMFGKKASSDAVRWQNFAIYFIPSETYEKQSLKELVDKYPLRYMVATQMMDANGRPMSVVGDYNSDPEGSLVLHITEKMNFSAYFLGIAIHKMIDVGLMGPERIMSEIIEPCILFDESNYDIIRQGLDFFFEGKYILACHIIVPQIENAIRNLVEKSGISVIKPQHKRNGFQLLTLDELLRTKAIEDAFTSDGALYLRLVLTDQRSLNIRNLLCHGIVPPQYFESGAAARLLHVLIMLGMVKETS